jgi:hypothetical protein
VFYEFFPHAGRLDPNNSDDAQLIEYWKDIQHQICNGPPGQYSWDNPQPEQLYVVSIEAHPSRHGAGRHLQPRRRASKRRSSSCGVGRRRSAGPSSSTARRGCSSN